MLLTRTLPLRFLLPAWSSRQLKHVLQKFYTFDNANKQTTPRRRTKSRTPAILSNTPTKSLFEELFPEEGGIRRNVDEPKLEKLPPFRWNDTFGSAEAASAERDAPQVGSSLLHVSRDMHASEKIQRTPQMDREDEKRRREASVLVLNSASKKLEESDFFRISLKGTHIEGWTNGIIKVIQGRDSHTLEPLGHYFILFDSDNAARAYLDQTIRLHKLAKSHIGSLAASTLPLPRGLLKDGEDINEVIRSFSLVPGQGRLSLRMINRPYQRGMTRVLSEGGPKGIASRQSRGEGLVLFSLDSGQISAYDLKSAFLRPDGKRRNLHWSLAEDPIVRLDEEQDDGKGIEGLAAGDKTWKRVTRSIIAFKDHNEARRFVREWHRRPFPVRRWPNPGDEAPPIVSAEYLW